MLRPGALPRPEPQLADKQPADDADGDEREEFEHAGILYNADQDLDGDGHQENEDRAEQGSRGNRPRGPGWKTAQGVMPADTDLGHLAPERSTPRPGRLTLAEPERRPFDCLKWPPAGWRAFRQKDDYFPISVGRSDDGTDAGEQGNAKDHSGENIAGTSVVGYGRGRIPGTSLPGAALAAATVWEGYATITASTPPCSGIGGTAPGDTHVSIFRPKLCALCIGPPDTPTYLSFVFLRAALTQENTSESTVHQMNGSGNYSGFLVGSHALFSQYTGAYNLTLTPVTITAATPSVIIDGTITNFLNTTGCNVSFEGAYVQRID